MIILIDSLSSGLFFGGSACARRANQDVCFRSCGTTPDNFYLSVAQRELLSRPFALKPVGWFRAHIPIAFGLNQGASVRARQPLRLWTSLYAECLQVFRSPHSIVIELHGSANLPATHALADMPPATYPVKGALLPQSW